MLSRLVIAFLPRSLSEKALSRRFDIEFKTMYFYNYDADKDEYVAIEIEVPMLFIQEEKYSNFVSDFNDKNSDYLTTPAFLTVTQGTLNAINYAYEVVLPAYNTIKNAVTHDMITQYCRI